jgi:hypothetical protein
MEGMPGEEAKDYHSKVDSSGRYVLAELRSALELHKGDAVLVDMQYPPLEWTFVSVQ